jgi:hypothetical protein
VVKEAYGFLIILESFFRVKRASDLNTVLRSFAETDYVVEEGIWDNCAQVKGREIPLNDPGQELLSGSLQLFDHILGDQDVGQLLRHWLLVIDHLAS